MENKQLETETSPAKKALLVDDVPKNLQLLSDLLSKNGYEISTALSGPLALRYLETQTPDIILLDIKMPGMNGFEVCQEIKANQKTRHIPIIFISALGDIEDKISAFNVGGVDYVTKPIQIEEVLARVNTHTTIQRIQKQLETAYATVEAKVVERTMDLQQANDNLQEEIKTRLKTEKKLQDTVLQLEDLKDRLNEENIYLQEEINTVHNFSEIIGTSDALQKTLKMIEQVAPSETTVLITGETGTGKELLARAIHNRSKRKNRPLVKVNCAALPANIIESELFGHEKGAFTGAFSQKIGRFELADRGTIFLDELGDLPLELQAKLLRVLQEGEFERLGGRGTLKINARVIAATNRDLTTLRSEGKFRDDLFFRLDSFPIRSPSLRERKEDIPMLVKYFLEKYSTKIGRKIDKISPKTIKRLQEYHWPGNIRELENEIERSVILSPGNELMLWDRQASGVESKIRASFPTMEQIQKEHILSALEASGGKVSGDFGAAKLLGLKSTTLNSRMKKLGLKLKKGTYEIK